MDLNTSDTFAKKKSGMELPFQIEAQNGALSFVDLFTEKRDPRGR